ncbi:MAG: acyl carrier protein [Thermodesulfovibrionia bacterium]|nr:acyl carrier protein [Thermodesulfovibrionia bacterium]
MGEQAIKSLKNELKEMIVEACNLDKVNITADHIKDEEPLIDPSSPLGIDSLDAVEIVAALEKKYRVRIRDVNTSRQVLKSINTLADFVYSEMSSS